MLTGQPRVSATIPNINSCFWKNNTNDKLVFEMWGILCFLISDLEKQTVMSTPTSTKHIS